MVENIEEILINDEIKNNSCGMTLDVRGAIQNS